LQIEPLEQRDLLAALTWSPGVNLPAARAGAAAVETAAGAILVIGGGTTTVNQLSSGSSSWGTANSIDIARNYPGVGSAGTSLLVYGGNTGGTPLEEVLTYDPYNIDIVQDAQVLTTPRTQFGFASDANHPYAIGGLGSGNTVLASVERYDVASDSWSNVASLPQSRYAFPAVDDGAGHIYTLGGATTYNSTSVSNTVYRYTVATNSWATIASMPTATRDSAAVLGSNGRIYVLGGSAGGNALSTVQSYDPTTNTWTVEPSLPAPISGAAAVTDALGRIEVIGGFDQSHTAVSTVTVSQQLNAPDVAPSITSTAPASTMVDAPYAYQVVASGNPQPTYSLITSPAGMTISAGTGLISWTPTLAQAGLNSVKVRATNVVGFVEQSFSVRALTPAPTVPNGLSVTSTTTNSVTLGWNPANDSVGVTGYRVYRVTKTGWHGTHTTYTQLADIPGITATISGLSAGSTYKFVVAAYNASGNQSGYSPAVSATTLIGPTYWGPTTVNVVANHPLSFTLSASGNPATFTYTPLAVPSGMTVNATSGQVNWTPSDANVGSGSYSFSISNGVGTVTAVVSVNVTTNLPNVTYVQSGAAVATQPYSVQFSQVSDPYNSSPVIYSLLSAPAGVAINPNTGLVSWTPTAADVGTASITVRATNYAGVRDTSLAVPVYFASAVQNVVASNPTTSGATITWLPPAISAGEVAGYHVHASYRVRSGRFNTTHSVDYTTVGAGTSLVLAGLPISKSISVSVTAFDAANHDGLAGQTSFITAHSTPTVTVSGPPATYDGAIHAATAVAYGDGGVTTVSGSFTFTYNDSAYEPTEPGTYIVVATFYSSDPYYSDAVGTGTLTIVPAAPSLVVDGGPFTYDGTAHPVTATAYALDGVTPIDGSFTFQYEGSPTPPTNPGIYSVTANFTSNEPRYANAVSSGTLTITSTGSLAPTLVLSGGPFTYDGAAHTATAIAYANDGFTPINGTFSFSYDGSPSSPTDAGTHAVVVSFASRNPAYADATRGSTLVINPAVPALLIGGDAIYDGLPHDATAMASGLDGLTPIAGSFTFTYDGSPAAPTEPGTYAVAASFTSGDSNYKNRTILGNLTISPATPAVIINGGWFTYDGMNHTASAEVLGVDGVTPVAGALAIAYYSWDNNTLDYQLLTSPPVDAGVYLVSANFTSSDAHYFDASTSDYLWIIPAEPTVAISGGPFAFDGASHQVTAAVYGLDGVTPVNGSWTIYYNGETSPPSAAGTYAVDAYFTSADANFADTYASASMTIAPVIVGRQLFYNQSVFDGNSSAINAADDDAIATNKSAYMPGNGIATFANVSSFSRGINGIIVDIAGSHPDISAADFSFRIGNNNAPGGWIDAPDPTAVVVRAGAGSDEADRVEITWASGAIKNTWLEVQVLATANTGLATADVHFWGNKVGDVGTGTPATTFVTSAADKTSVLGGAAGGVPITNPRDFNRDGNVTAADATIVLNSVGAIGRLQIGAGGPFAPATKQASSAAAAGDAGVASALAATSSSAFTREAWSASQPLLCHADHGRLDPEGVRSYFQNWTDQKQQSLRHSQNASDGIGNAAELNEELLDDLVTALVSR